MAARKSTPVPRRLKDRALRSLHAVAEARSVVQHDAALFGDDLLRDAAKVLEAITTLLERADKASAKELRAGTKWARKTAPGGRAPQREIVETLHELVVRMQGNDDGIAVQAAIDLLATGNAPGQMLVPLVRKIRSKLARAHDRAETDRWTLVKRILQAAGMTEREASNALHGARLK